jgi:hypothetical protein
MKIIGAIAVGAFLIAAAFAVYVYSTFCGGGGHAFC